MRKKVYHSYSFNFFCLTVSKKFVGEQIDVSENFGYQKNLCIRREYHYFPLESFLSHSTDTILKEHFCVSKTSGIENFHA